MRPCLVVTLLFLPSYTSFVLLYSTSSLLSRSFPRSTLTSATTLTTTTSTITSTFPWARRSKEVRIIDDSIEEIDDNDDDNHDKSNSKYQQPASSSYGSTRRRDVLLSSSTAAAAAAMLTARSLFPSVSVWAYNADEDKRIAVFEKTSPSVVFIDTFSERKDVFSPNVLEVPLGSGSGFVWDKQGHIVTNFHVVRNAQSAQVAILTDSIKLPSSVRGRVTAREAIPSSSSSVPTPLHMTTSSDTTYATSGFGSGKTMRSVFQATVVGVDPSKDVAVLKVNAPPSLLFPITVGTSTGLRVGQQSLAIGNPFGLDHTLTAGIISGTGREVKSPIGRPITNVIQTDAAINPGNSGGPLLDSSGKLIGMNTAIYSPSGASAGIGFAIPVDTVKYIVEALIRDGQIIRPVLGIKLLDSRQARALGIASGVLILEVPEGTPAAMAGLKGTRRTEAGLIELGDVIIKLGDVTINNESDLFQALDNFKVGDVVKVTVNRVMAVEDELRLKEVVILVTLQSSVEVEKNMMHLYQYPLDQ